MNRSEVFDLMIEIKRNYSGFDVSNDEVDRHYKYLKDFPFDAAMKNVDDHVKTNQYYPKIAEIRGRLGDQLDSLRGKEQALAHEAQLAEWASKDSPPPEGYWDDIRSKLRGERN
ncbi:hypothetical protein D3C73_811010 [compost metagenome]